jgi:hypothetical protein
MTVFLSAEQARDLSRQAAVREGGEQAAAVTWDGRVLTRSTAGVPATALAL